MFQELTGKEINQIVVLVVTEDGTVQEFIKCKHDYTHLLVDALSEWREQNEEVPNNLAAGVAKFYTHSLGTRDSRSVYVPKANTMW